MRRKLCVPATAVILVGGMLLGSGLPARAAGLAKGLATRDLAPANRAYPSVVNSETVDLFWRDLQTSDDGPLLQGAKDNITAMVNAAATSCTVPAPVDGCGVSSIRLRVFSGIYSPDWVRTKYGQTTIFPSNTPNDCTDMNDGNGDNNPAPGCQLPRFWKKNLTLVDYDDLINRLDNYIESQDSHNIIKSIVLCGPMTVYCEPFITQAAVADSEGLLNCQRLLNDGFTGALQKTALNSLNTVAKTLQNNQAIISYNFFQFCAGEPSDPRVGNEDYDFVKSAMNDLVIAVGVNNAIIQMNNLRIPTSGEEQKWCVPNDAARNNELYQHMKQKHNNAGWAVAFQTARFEEIEDLKLTIECGINMGAHYIELPGNTSTQGYGTEMSQTKAEEYDTALNNNG